MRKPPGCSTHPSAMRSSAGSIGWRQISETPEHLTRIFLTPEHRAAADLILAGCATPDMRAHLDAIGNVCGRYEGDRPGLPCLMLGSHYDTVRDAGKWDGPLGLITAISCVADLHKRGRRLAVRDRGDRFRRRGGGAICIDPARQPRGRRDLQRARAGSKDEAGITDARGAGPVRARSRSYRRGREGSAASYWPMSNLHIEQGPVLEANICRSGS
jgi:allantoate deiminase